MHRYFFSLVITLMLFGFLGCEREPTPFADLETNAAGRIVRNGANAAKEEAQQAAGQALTEKLGSQYAITVRIGEDPIRHEETWVWPSCTVGVVIRGPLPLPVNEEALRAAASLPLRTRCISAPYIHLQVKPPAPSNKP
jgi:hypothetical protein